MESPPQNPEFRNNPESFHPCNRKDLPGRIPVPFFLTNKLACSPVPKILQIFFLSGHSKIDKTKVLKTNGSLMKVESFAELEHSAILLTCIKR